MFHMLVVRYNKDSIIPLYIVLFNIGLESSAPNFEFVPIGVLLGLESIV